jgi:HK97 gp10 family phage protein
MPIVLTGMKELLGNLDKIGKNVKAVRAKALMAGAEIIRKEIAVKCPRGSQEEVLSKKYSPGRHGADNIAISPMKTENGIESVDVGPSRGDNNDFFYLKFLEFGTVKMSAEPFVEPAIIEKRDEALSAMADVIREAIEKG